MKSTSRSTSLVRRATVAVLGIELLCGLGFSAAALLHEREARWHALDMMLHGRTDSLIGAVQDAEDPQAHVIIDPEEFSPARDDEYAVYDPNEKLIGGSQPALDVVPLQQHDGMRNVSSGGLSYRVLQRHALRIIDRAETGGAGLRRPIAVVYAVRTDRLWHQVFEATQFYLLLCVGTVGVTALLLVVFARRLLLPLRELAAAAGSIEPASLEFEAPRSAMETKELRPLGEALHLMVARVRGAFEAEKRFFHDAAHELKTAAAVVRSSVQVLNMKPRGAEEYSAGLDRVLLDNERLEDLIARMLTLARYEGNAQNGAARSNLGEQVAYVAEALASYAESREVRIEVERNGAAMVNLSAEAAQTLISNLVMNAIQHSSTGSAVRVRISANGAASAALTVQDEGCGIAPENLPHVFDRFFREDKSRSRETGGAGLGLSICKGIVESAGGEIGIDSAPGRGTTVMVDLKLA
jgi:signal transduction histidine kinase